MELDPRVSDANFTDPSQSQSLSNLNQLFFVSGKAGHLIYTYIYIYYVHTHAYSNYGWRCRFPTCPGWYLSRYLRKTLP